LKGIQQLLVSNVLAIDSVYTPEERRLLSHVVLQVVQLTVLRLKTFSASLIDTVNKDGGDAASKFGSESSGHLKK